ncbi:MAG TPA: DUF86 domain-containing protein [Thermoanaerobaculia bacterium]|nr:DUF86 domain-containing protein [Thermoanaerobaculia bacterium]
MSRDHLLFLQDIEQAGQRIIRYTEGRERDEVYADEMRFDAVLHNLHVIGEAVKRLPETFRQRYSDVPWREIAGMRDFVAHAYFALDLEILWDAIQNDVPALARQVADIARIERGEP